MKKYTICFILFICTATICFLTGYFVTRHQVKVEEPISNVTIETEVFTEDSLMMEEAEAEPVINKDAINQYYLVSEAGYLLVLTKDKETICLYTHMPLTDFPLEEQERLMEGIWFSNMMDILNYLESYTS